jgi:glycosyltransferase involved in cell wall biosynthesis
MLALHSHLHTWNRLVDAYIVFSQFYLRMFADAGLPPDKIHVKPHFVPSNAKSRSGAGEYALFVGRLAPEKGIQTLLAAWDHLKPISIPLKIRGDGPLLPRVAQFASTHHIDVVPRLSRGELTTLIQGARFLIWPSEGYYETFGLVAIEAFACGVPVIASRSGVMAEIVHHQSTGLHFAPGDAKDLAATVKWAWTHPEEMAAMGRAAGAEYELKYTPQRNYELLIDIYRKAVRCEVSQALERLECHVDPTA